MKKYEDAYIIGIDHGYGNMKTANCCFPTGVAVSDTEPTFAKDLLVWKDRYYNIGVGHKEFTATKDMDGDFYVLTLAAIARELGREKVYDAGVWIAAGLPLTWVSQQREAFKAYLLKEKAAEFTFRGKAYHIRIKGAEVFPQGFSAVMGSRDPFSGLTMLCDIGNGTMNSMILNGRIPDPSRCFTDKYGTHQCLLQVRETLLREHGMEPPDALITEVFRFGKAEMDKVYLDAVTAVAREYTAEIFHRLRDHGYDPRVMKLYVVGGGGVLVKNFGEYDAGRVIINDDLCATAKGYEQSMELLLHRGEKR